MEARRAADGRLQPRLPRRAHRTRRPGLRPARQGHRRGVRRRRLAREGSRSRGPSRQAEVLRDRLGSGEEPRLRRRGGREGRRVPPAEGRRPRDSPPSPRQGVRSLHRERAFHGHRAVAPSLRRGSARPRPLGEEAVRLGLGGPCREGDRRGRGRRAPEGRKPEAPGAPRGRRAGRHGGLHGRRAQARRARSRASARSADRSIPARRRTPPGFAARASSSGSRATRRRPRSPRPGAASSFFASRGFNPWSPSGRERAPGSRRTSRAR